MTESVHSRVHLSPFVLLLLVVLPFFSGAAALSHELLWTRRLIDLLGATEWVVGRVLGIFFFGLSLGGYLATLPSRRSTPSILRLARIEILIAFLALPAAFLPSWTEWIWASLGTELLVSWQGALIKLLLTIVVVMPPAVAMGFTLPLFIRAVTDRGASVASIGVWIYAVNTMGGVFGLLITSTFLLSQLGAQWTMILTSFVNAGVGLILWQLYPTGMVEQVVYPEGGGDRIQEMVESVGAASAKEVSRWGLLALSFFSGFVVLALEVLLLRLISLVVPGSYHTTSALLANVILVLALGSGAVSLANSFRSVRHLVKNKMLLVAAFFGASVFIGLCPSFLYEATDNLINVRYIQALNGRTIDSIGHYWRLVFWLVATSGGLALLFCGLVFPILMTMSSDRDPGGKDIGILLAVNGIGGLIGTELFNSLLIGSVGIYLGFVLLAVIVLLIAFVILWPMNRWLAIGGAISMGVFVAAGFQMSKDLPYLSPRATRGLKVQSTHFGRDGTWLIVEKPSGATGILANNQYYLGGSGALVAQRRQLLLPWLMKSDAKSVCCLGLATGISASGLEGVQDPPPVTAVELSSNVAQLAKRFFGDETGGFFNRSDNEVVVEDARTFVAAANNQFDLIVGDLYRPHGTGEGRLFSVEHFRNVRRSLTDDGLYCQWLPMHQLNQEDWRTIAATFQAAFPETLVLYCDPNIGFPSLGFMGRKNDQKWEKPLLEACLKNVDAHTLTLDPFLKDARELVVGVLKPDVLEDEQINTLDNLKVEISAGDFWILKDLRKKRKQSYETEFLKGLGLIKFNDWLEEAVEPVFPTEHSERLRRRLRKQLKAR